MEKESSLIPTLRSENLANALTYCFRNKMYCKSSSLRYGLPVLEFGELHTNKPLLDLMLQLCMNLLQIGFPNRVW